MGSENNVMTRPSGEYKEWYIHIQLCIAYRKIERELHGEFDARGGEQTSTWARTKGVNRGFTHTHKLRCASFGRVKMKRITRAAECVVCTYN